MPMSVMASAGYSGTPLAKKLSLKDGMTVWFDAMPDSVLGEIAAYGLTLKRLDAPTAGIDAAHAGRDLRSQYCHANQ